MIVEVVADATVGCEVRRLIRECRGLSTELEAARTIDPAAAEQDRTRHGGTGHGVHRLVPWEGAFWHRTPEIEGSATTRVCHTRRDICDRRDRARWPRLSPRQLQGSRHPSI